MSGKRDHSAENPYCIYLGAPVPQPVVNPACVSELAVGGTVSQLTVTRSVWKRTGLGWVSKAASREKEVALGELPEPRADRAPRSTGRLGVRVFDGKGNDD